MDAPSHRTLRAAAAAVAALVLGAGVGACGRENVSKSNDAGRPDAVTSTNPTLGPGTATDKAPAPLSVPEQSNNPK